MRVTTQRGIGLAIAIVVYCSSSLPGGAAAAGGRDRAAVPLPVASHVEGHNLQPPTNATLTELYALWEKRHVARGGDRNVELRFGWSRGLSPRRSAAHGVAEIDLVAGRVEVTARRLDAPLDVWLLDNVPGGGRTALAEPGDRLVRLGTLQPAAQSTLAVDLGAEHFRDFELDWLIATEAGKSPLEGGLLFGTRSLFAREFTRSRLAAEGGSPVRSRLAPRTTTAASGSGSSSTALLVSRGLVSPLVGTGADLFFRGTFSGNGRTCATCHPAENNQTLDAAFIGTLPAHDPLFVAERAPSQGGVPGLERAALLRGFGLILENVDGLEDPTVKFAMRGVPHSLSMATSITAPADGRAPTERTGWSGDGAPAPGTLRMFSLGATIQHFPRSLARQPGTDFRAPTDEELDAMEAFMLSAGRLDDLDLSQVTLRNPQARTGLAIFNNQDPLVAPAGQCFRCHVNAGANASFSPTNRNFDTGVENVINPARAVEAFPGDGGFGSAPLDLDGDGVPDRFGDGTFNSVGLVESADTAPFFHNNVAATIEAAVEFYSGPEFNASPGGAAVGGISLLPAESAQVAAFLRVLNAAFNTDQALQRNHAALVLLAGGPSGTRPTVDKLLELSNVEARHALRVLSEKGLHRDAQSYLRLGVSTNSSAIRSSDPAQKALLALTAYGFFRAAKTLYGTGLDFTMGEGNLLF